MNKFLAAFLPLMLLLSPAGAESPLPLIVAFDRLCVSTQLIEKRFLSNAKISAMRKLPGPMAQASGPNKHLLTGLFDGEIVMATFGVRAGSRNCTVSTRKVSEVQLKEAVESNFPVKEVDSFKQGLSKMTIYVGQLAGYSRKTAISIQYDASAGMAVLGLFELQ